MVRPFFNSSGGARLLFAVSHCHFMLNRASINTNTMCEFNSWMNENLFIYWGETKRKMRSEQGFPESRLFWSKVSEGISLRQLLGGPHDDVPRQGCHRRGGMAPPANLMEFFEKSDDVLRQNRCDLICHFVVRRWVTLVSWSRMGAWRRCLWFLTACHAEAGCRRVGRGPRRSQDGRGQREASRRARRGRGHRDDRTGSDRVRSTRRQRRPVTEDNAGHSSQSERLAWHKQHLHFKTRP